MPPDSEAPTFFYHVKSIPLWILNTSINPITPNKQKGKENRIAIGKMNPPSDQNVYIPPLFLRFVKRKHFDPKPTKNRTRIQSSHHQ
jgi:hypothetical protein